jgi:hypothetical protein
MNYPYDDAFKPFESALTFGITAAGLVPVCGLDISAPDTLRLDAIGEAINNCYYSVHDLSRQKRMNMPYELGMATLRHARETQRGGHRCGIFVSSPHDYKKYLSDLAGLDLVCYNGDSEQLLIAVYEWLRDVVAVPKAYMLSQPTSEVIKAFAEFSSFCGKVVLAGSRPHLGHRETREVMYRVCGNRGWWDWRGNRHGRDQFPEIPLQWKEDPQDMLRSVDTIMEPL